MKKSQPARCLGRLIACAAFTRLSAVTSILATLLVLAVAPARADWPNTNATKFVQYPDTTSNAMDIYTSWNTALADDFVCTNTGQITDLHIWGAWLGDQVDPNATFGLAIFSDVPVSATNAFSHPGVLLWMQTFTPGTYSSRPVAMQPEQFYYPNQGTVGNSVYLWQYNFYPATPFVQQGSATAPVIYWLGMKVIPSTSTNNFGWKTSTNHFNDKAVFSQNSLSAPWQSLQTTFPVDLAFALTTTSPCGSATPPTAKLISPSWTNVCGLVSVVGSAYDSLGLSVSYTLAYRPIAGGAWTIFASGLTPVVNGLLGVWDTTSLAGGYYMLRLTVNNACNLGANDEAVVYVCQGPPSLTVTSPVSGSVVGGQACIWGTAYGDWCFCYYTVEYRPAGTGNFKPVDPANPTYTNTVINNLLASWNVQTLPDGNYDLRITACDCCGHCVTDLISPVTVDNTAPVAVITAPQACTRVNGLVIVQGTVSDANWGRWVLEYSGGDAHGWVTIGSGSASVVNGVLGVWDTSALRPCSYLLRLMASDRSALSCGCGVNQTEYTVAVTTQDCPIPPSLGASISSTAAVVSVTGQTNVSYTVEYTPVLPPTNGWTPLSSFVLTNNPQRVLDFSISNTPQRFYRARTP